MEKQSRSGTIANYAKKLAQPSIGLFGILKEAFITSIRNGWLLVFITIVTLSFYTAMDFSNVFIFIPIAKSFLEHAALLPNNSLFEADPVSRKLFLSDFKHVLTYGFAYLGFLSLLLIFAVTASVHSSFEAYTGKVLSLRDMLLGIKGRWRRALKTSFWMGLISSAIVSFLFFVLVIVTIISEPSSLASVYRGFGIAAVFGAVYLFSLGMVAVVVSVVEEEFSGLKAIGEAGELMKGKKFQGFGLTAVMVLSSWGLSAVFGFLERGIFPKLEDEKLAMMVGLAIGFPQNTVFWGLMLFGFVAFTVYYHECKQRKMEKETRALYAPLAVAQF